MALLSLTLLGWALALVLTARVLIVWRGLRRVPDLAPAEVPGVSSGIPMVTVIVPARNEATGVESCIRSLLRQSIPLDIVAVDDRSTDQTGVILDRLAAEIWPAGKSLRVLHVDGLPEGWLGKPHAMALAAREAATRWLLFTDGDVIFRNDTLARALQSAAKADHLVLMPTLILKTAGERMMAAFFQSMSLLGWNPWRVADPDRRESVGVGAFNLIRAETYHAVGGFEAQRMQVLDDVRLGVEVKRAGYRQQVVFGREQIRVHWAPGAVGMARNLTKNLFAAFGFSPPLLLGGCLGLALVIFGPLAELALRGSIRASGVVSLVALALLYRLATPRFSGLKTGWVATMPMAAILVLYAMLRSMLLTLVRGGVVWRETFYPLKELRRHTAPLH